MDLATVRKELKVEQIFVKGRSSSVIVHMPLLFVWIAFFPAIERSTAGSE